MALEHDELLAEEGVFEQELRPGTGEVEDCTDEQGVSDRLGVKANALSGSSPERSQATGEGKARDDHGGPFGGGMRAVILPRNRVVGGDSETDGVFGQHTRRERGRSEIVLARGPMVSGWVHRLASWLRRLATHLGAQKVGRVMRLSVSV